VFLIFCSFYVIFCEPVVLYACETWSLTWRDECGLRDLKTETQRRMHEPERDGITGGLRELHNEGLHNCYSSPNIMKIFKLKWIRCVRDVICMGEACIQSFSKKCWAIRLLENPILGWQDDIKMHLKEIGREVVYWDYVTKDQDYWGAVLNTVMNFRVP
jgi:hypothetical protein